jgi:GTP-binding protein
LKFQKSPVLLAVNKSENLKNFEMESSKYLSLGLGEPIPISAIHGTNTGELLDQLVSKIPKITIPYRDNIVKVAIVGKPNAGKSSLLNFLNGK